MNIWRAKRAENFGVTVEENMKMVAFSGQYALLRTKSRNLLLRLVVVGELCALSYQSRLPEENRVHGPLHLPHLWPPVYNSAFSMRLPPVWSFRCRFAI